MVFGFSGKKVFRQLCKLQTDVCSTQRLGLHKALAFARCMQNVKGVCDPASQDETLWGIKGRIMPTPSDRPGAVTSAASLSRPKSGAIV